MPGRFGSWNWYFFGSAGSGNIDGIAVRKLLIDGLAIPGAHGRPV